MLHSRHIRHMGEKSRGPAGEGGGGGGGGAWPTNQRSMLCSMWFVSTIIMVKHCSPFSHP